MGAETEGKRARSGPVIGGTSELCEIVSCWEKNIAVCMHVLSAVMKFSDVQTMPFLLLMASDTVLNNVERCGLETCPNGQHYLRCN